MRIFNKKKIKKVNNMSEFSQNDFLQESDKKKLLKYNNNYS